MSFPTSYDNRVVATLEALRYSTLNHVFLIACGGSLSVLKGAKVLFDIHCNIASSVYNAAEFLALTPKVFSEDSLVILCSTTGTTRETTDAAQFAKEKGATTIGFTADRDSPLANVVEHVIEFEAHYTTGIPIDSKDSNYSRIYQLIMGLVSMTGGEDLNQPLADSIFALQPAIDRAIKTFGPLFAEYAPRFANEDIIYSLASGADYGASYSFSICVLMEMLWINSQAIHANEFFHGPFEVLDENRAFVLLKGLDRSRPLEERAERFLHLFGSTENILVLDAKELDLSGIDERFQGNMVPLIFFDTLWHFAYKLADMRQHKMLEGRRYMKKVVCL